MQNKESVGEWVDISILVENPRNPRVNDQAVESVAKSIKRFGFSSPIIARRANNMIIAGHTRYKASIKLGLSTVPVRYLDLDPADADLLMIADNKIGEKADWNNDLLSEILTEMNGFGLELDVLGFSDEELSNLIDTMDVLGNGDISDAEDFTSETKEIISQKGEQYKLGDHILICGDSTDKATYASIKNINLYLTDPPYGVSYVGKTKDALTIQNDELQNDDLMEFLYKVFSNALDVMNAGASYYIFSPVLDVQLEFARALKKLDILRNKLVWVKHHFTFGRLDYQLRHEDVYYGWKKGAPHYFVDVRNKSSVLEFDRPTVSEIHPTMKPIDLLEELISNSSHVGDTVLDTFGGSGSTMIACQNLKRKSILIELDPKYCDAIRRRWKQYALERNLDVGDGID